MSGFMKLKFYFDDAIRTLRAGVQSSRSKSASVEGHLPAFYKRIEEDCSPRFQKRGSVEAMDETLWFQNDSQLRAHLSVAPIRKKS